MLNNAEKEEMISKIRNRNGEISDLESVLKNLKENDPYFESSDRMLYIEEDFLSWKEYQNIKKDFNHSEENILNAIRTCINYDDGHVNDVLRGAYMYLLNDLFPGKDIRQIIFGSDTLLSDIDIYNELKI